MKSSSYRGKLVVARRGVNAIRQPHVHPTDSYLGMMRHNAKTLAAPLAH